MEEQIISRLARIRQRFRWVITAQGLGIVVSWLVAAFLLLGVTDWLLHLDEPWLRLMLVLGCLAAAAYWTWIVLIRPLRLPIDDVELALRVESRHPQLKHSLASAVQFLKSGFNPQTGSPDLQKSVLQRVWKQVRRLSFEEIVDVRPARRWTLIALVLCVTAGLFILINRDASAIAMQRLAWPFASVEWPRTVNLRLLNSDFQPWQSDADDPLRIPVGESLKLYVENATGRLPTRVQLEQIVREQANRELLRVVTLRDPSGAGHEVAVVELRTVQGPSRFRVVAGDDQSMPYQEIIGVPVPAVDDLQITLTPPRYTGHPARTLPAGVVDLEALRGTRVQLQGRSNRALKSAAVRIRDQQRVPATVSEDGLQFSAVFDLQESGVGNYRLELVDREGFENPQPPRYELRVSDDATPEISLELPASDLQATANAELPLRLIARDDLALQRLDLVVKVNDQQVSEHLPQLWSAPKSPEQMLVESEQTAARAGLVPGGKPAAGGSKPPGQTAPGASSSASAGVPMEITYTREQTEDRKWSLEPLQLAPGTRLTLHVEARDFHQPEHVGRSLPRMITIVSPSEKQSELDGRQAGLLEDLERVRKLQALAADQVRELEIQAKQTGRLRTEDGQSLQRVEMTQRQIAGQLQQGTDSLDQQLKELLQEFRTNQLTDAETERRLTTLSQEISRLGENVLPEIEQDLTRARKLAQASIDQSAGEPPAGKSSAADPNSTRPDDAREQGPLPTAETKTDRTPAEPASPEDKSDPGTAQAASQPSGTEKPSPGAEKPQGNPSAPREDAADLDTPGQEKPPGSEPRKNTDAELEQTLERLTERQAGVVESLNELTQQLDRWRNERETQGELNEIANQQAEVADQTRQLAEKTLSKPAADLTPDERAELAKLMERQQKQAERVESLQRRLDDLSQRLQERNPDQARELADAAQRLRENGTSGKMRDAAGQIGENRLGRAQQTQSQILDSLRAAEEGRKPDAGTEELIKQERQLEQELQQLTQQQEELVKQVAAAEQLTDPAQRDQELLRLKKQQQDLADQLAAAGRKLERLQKRNLSEKLSQAASRLRRAAEQMGSEPAAAQEEQQAALEQLEDASAELEEERMLDEEQLAFEQLEKIADQLQALALRQTQAVLELERLAGLRKGAANWTRAQLVSLRNQATVQRQLADEATTLAESLSAAKVYALTLKSVARQMTLSAEKVQNREADEPAQIPARIARDRLQELIALLKNELKPPDEQKPNPQKPDQSQPAEQGASPPGDGVGLLSEFKLLKTLQVDLLERTRQFEAKIAGAEGPLNEEDQRTQAALSAEQSELADLARDLMSLLAEETAAEEEGMEGESMPGEDDPDSDQNPKEELRPRPQGKAAKRPSNADEPDQKSNPAGRKNDRRPQTKPGAEKDGAEDDGDFKPVPKGDSRGRSRSEEDDE